MSAYITSYSRDIKRLRRRPAGLLLLECQSTICVKLNNINLKFNKKNCNIIIIFNIIIIL